jgi:hypothetical protein
MHADLLLTAIRQFIQSCPLATSPIRDVQPHLNPNERVGTILLPLWRQTPIMNTHSPHWPAFLELLRTLRPYLIECSRAMRSTAPYAYDGALQNYRDQLFGGDQATTIPQITPENCFQTLRISANMALAAHPLRTSHPSFWVVIAAVGPFNYGDVGLTDLGEHGQWYRIGTQGVGRGGIENILTVRTALNVQSLPFVGERTNWSSSCHAGLQILACDVIIWLGSLLSRLQAVNNSFLLGSQCYITVQSIMDSNFPKNEEG